MPGSPAPPIAISVSARRSLLGFAGVCVGYFAIILDGSVLNVAVPVIRADLGSTMSGAQWVLNGYTLVLAALLLTASALGDRIGHRRLLLAGLLLFALASAACAVAGNTTALVVSRAAQGLGAAGLLPATLALVPHLFPPGPRRERATVAWVTIGAAAMAVGPFLGGVLIDAFGWRAIFLINLPVGLACGLLVWAGVTETPRRQPRMDHGGQLLAAAALGLLTSGLIAGGSGWVSPVTLGLLGLGVLASAAFVVVERRVAAPLLPPSFLAGRVPAVAVLSALFMGFLFYGALFVMSLYFQQLRGWAPSVAGTALLPFTVGPVLAPVLLYRPLARRLSHPKMLVAGFACCAAGTVILAFIGAGTAYPVVGLGLLLAGAASTVVFSALTSLLMATVSGVSAERAGLASGVQNTARQSGALIGVAVFGSVLGTGAFAERLPISFAIMAAVEVIGIAAGIALLRATGRLPGNRPRGH